jgi:hypothetical protein
MVGRVNGISIVHNLIVREHDDEGDGAGANWILAAFYAFMRALAQGHVI